MPSLGVVITGASSGLGLHALRRLIESGHRVVAGVRGGESRLTEILGGAASQAKGRLWAVDLHLDRPDTFPLARRAVDEFLGGRLDVLVNNAGYGLFGAIEDQSEAQIRRQFEVNTLGPIGLSRALLPQIKAARGRIINVISAAGFWTMPLYGTYCASKAALEALTEGMYYDLKPSGVQVGLLEPGGFRTNFIGTAKVVAEGKTAEARSDALVRFLEKSGPHLLDPDKVAAKLVRMCERRHLPLRTLAGIDAHFVNLLSRFLPDFLRARFQDWLFRKLVFKE
jgi:NAD(P)-dependent dehydrogenase (short-subunit alcohol dehydrogenase family)